VFAAQQSICYAIAPLRASVAEILIEQTVGYGLRLPYGRRTGDPLLRALRAAWFYA